MGVKENLELMKTLDDAWNAGPGSPLWETFRKRHREDVTVYWSCALQIDQHDLAEDRHVEVKT
jgi:hypothetical protein